MAPIRVLVVEDSLTIRRRIVEVLSTDPELAVVAEAVDGKRAIELCQEKRPDVVTMDMMLPVMTGLAATEFIMAHVPTPVLVVSSSFNRGELFRTYDALAAGAVDVLEKPTGHEVPGDWERRLVAAVKMVSRIRVITHPRARLGSLGRPRAAPADWPAAGPSRRPRAVALGASTGGPGAVLEILRALPAPFPVPLLVVIHVGAPFGAGLADWLDAQTPHSVAPARAGEPLASLAGRVAIAPPERHLAIRGGSLVLTADPPRHSCRPSVDVLFESMARELGADAAGCLLTGMGRDGGAGLLELRRAGGTTFAQDEATSVVYGMPREAALLGAAQRILPLSQLGAALSGLAGVAPADLAQDVER